MTQRFNTAFLTIELVVSLAIASVAFSAFLSVYHSVRRQHRVVQHRAAAVMLLQSVMEKLRAGQLPEVLEAGKWNVTAEGAAVFLAQPAPYQLENTGITYRWQLVAERPPEHGQLFTVQALISWQEGKGARDVKASTQVWWP